MRALVRPIPRSFAKNALRSDTHAVISQERAEAQHEAYTNVLRNVLGEDSVLTLPRLDDLADSLFVEDTVVCIPGHAAAVGMKMGHASRAAEASDVHSLLGKSLGYEVYNPTELTSHAVLDGGDVLFTGDGFLVGLSTRTNRAAFNLLKHLVKQIRPDWSVQGVPVPSALHLKSLCTRFDQTTLVAFAPFAQTLDSYTQMDILAVPDFQAANCLLLEACSSTLVIRSEFPESRHVLEQHAAKSHLSQLIALDMSEIAKADGALTCCSVLLKSN